MNVSKRKKKSGFTLVELMVVAIIVAILAAVAIPLMRGPTDTAMATEAQTGCNAVATGVKLYVVSGGDSATPAIADLPGVSAQDLMGTYFDSYAVSGVASNSYTIVASGRSGGKAEGATVTLTVVNGVATWSGFGQ